MAKSFKIAQPANFKAPVEIPKVGGGVLKVDFTFKYRDRLALADLFDEWNEKGKELVESARKEGATLKEVAQLEIDIQVDQVKEVAEGWGFDEPFDDDSIRQLVTGLNEAPRAILRAYSSAFQAARLGN